MKCPYRTVVIHHPQTTEGYIINPAKDVTDFAECANEECPFYQDDLGTDTCLKAKKEIQSEG